MKFTLSWLKEHLDTDEPVERRKSERRSSKRPPSDPPP